MAFMNDATTPDSLRAFSERVYYDDAWCNEAAEMIRAAADEIERLTLGGDERLEGSTPLYGEFNGYERLTIEKPVDPSHD
jgi:hypothetical protein